MNPILSSYAIPVFDADGRIVALFATDMEADHWAASRAKHTTGRLMSFTAKKYVGTVTLAAPSASDAFDDEGYPTDAALERIKSWDYRDARGLFAFVHSIWHWADIGYWREEDGKDDFRTPPLPVRRYFVSTGGWSGNESIIAALRKNVAAWHMTWVQHRRGGHYVFEVEIT